MPKPCETAARKLPKRCFWNLLKTKKKPASYQAKLKKKVFGTRMRKSRTPAGFVPKPLRNRSQENAKRRFWNPLKRKKYSAQTMRNRSRKTAETLLLEPTKNKEKKVAKGCVQQGTAQHKTWKPASHQANTRKRCLGRACEKAEPQQV